MTHVHCTVVRSILQRSRCILKGLPYTGNMYTLLRNILQIFFITIIPGVEVRGALPYAIGVLKMPVWEALLVATLANLCIAPLFYLLEKPILAVASRWAWFRRYRSRLTARSRSTLAKYGLFVGLAVFVAIPLHPFRWASWGRARSCSSCRSESSRGSWQSGSEHQIVPRGTVTGGPHEYCW